MCSSDLGRARTDGGGRRHHAAAARSLGEGLVDVERPVLAGGAAVAGDLGAGVARHVAKVEPQAGRAVLPAVEAAEKAFPAWQRVSPRERAGLMRRIADRIVRSARRVKVAVVMQWSGSGIDSKPAFPSRLRSQPDPMPLRRPHWRTDEWAAENRDRSTLWRQSCYRSTSGRVP